MSRGLKRSATVTQLLVPRYRSLIGDNRWSDPFFAMSNSGIKELEGGDCLATSLIAYSQFPLAKIVRETLLTEESGLETHYFVAEYLRGMNVPILDRRGKVVSVAGPNDHFRYWATVSGGFHAKSDYISRTTGLLIELLSTAERSRSIQAELFTEEERGTIRFTLIDPVNALREACGDKTASPEQLVAEVDKALENRQLKL